MLPPDIKPRLTRIILLLGSANDGEALGAARALERTLKAANLDLHDLIDELGGPRPSRRTIRARWKQTSGTTGTFSYADTFRESDPVTEGPEHPEALSRKFGLPIDNADVVESWPTVARHCLTLDRKLPKKHGGKILEDWHKTLLKSLIEYRRPSNRHVEWLEHTVARLHQARDAARRAEAAHD